MHERNTRTRASPEMSTRSSEAAAHIQWLLFNCLLPLLAPLCGVRWWIGWALAAVASAALAVRHVRKGRGRPPRTSAPRHGDIVTGAAPAAEPEAPNSPGRAKPEDPPRRERRSEKARQRARKRKRGTRRPAAAPRGREAWTRAEVAALPIRAKKRRVWEAVGSDLLDGYFLRIGA